MTTLGGIVGPVLCIVGGFAAVVVLGASTEALGTYVASLMIGLASFDALVAMGKARSRRAGQGTGRYSSMVGITAMLGFLWVVVASATPATGWTDNLGAAAVVGVVVVVAEAVVVRSAARR